MDICFKAVHPKYILLYCLLRAYYAYVLGYSEMISISEHRPSGEGLHIALWRMNL